MPYSAEVSRATPSCFLFVIDQSGSMSDPFAGSSTGRSKAEELADVINRLLQTLVTRCAKGEEVRDYFDVGVIGYGQSLGHGLQGPLAGRDFVPISQIAFNPVRLESRNRKVPDGAGGLVDQNFQFPVWFDPVHNGGTPMCEALGRAKSSVESWAAGHMTLLSADCHPRHRWRVDRWRPVGGRPADSSRRHGRRPGVPVQPAPVVDRGQADHLPGVGK